MIKVISDFDGVLTELAHEAVRVREIFYELLGFSARRDLQELIEQFVLSRPAEWGWEVEGRITAYGDEDGFIFNNALAMALDRMRGDSAILPSLDIARVFGVIQARGFASFKDVAVAAYNQMVEEVKASASSPLESDTPDLLRDWGGRGFSVTIVSNSGTSRIEDILQKSGLGVPGYLRIQGGAQKFSLGTTPDWLDFGGRRVDVNRPRYREILEAERPRVVIGDVFSLDLALPLALATQGKLGNDPVNLVLRERPYTPAWIKSWALTWNHPKVRMMVTPDLRKVASLFQ